MSIHNFTQFPIPAKQISASDVPYGASNVNAELAAQSTNITQLQTAVGMNINQWDEMWEVGGYNSSTGQPVVQANAIRTKNYINIKPSTVYFANSSAQIFCYWYDSNHAFISGTGAVINATMTSPNNAYYLRFETTSSYGETYNHDISINYPSSFTGYYPSALPKANAHIGGLGNVIGMRGWNQLLNKNNFPSSTTVSGVTVTNNADGTITLNGTASATTSFTVDTVSFISGHKYLISGDINSTNSTHYLFCSSNIFVEGWLSTERTCQIRTANQTGNFNIKYQLFSGVTYANLIVTPQLFDLTAMGLDYINSVDDFRAMFPADYYPYCSGSFCDLLWTNASPSSAFAGNTSSPIQLDLSKYSFVCIESLVETGNQSYAITTFVRKYMCSKMSFVTTGTGGVYAYARFLNITNSSIGFDNAYTAFGTSYEQLDNTKMIPYKIYGIR